MDKKCILFFKAHRLDPAWRLPPQDRILFFKTTFRNRPGLWLMPMIDALNRQTARWSRLHSMIPTGSGGGSVPSKVPAAPDPQPTVSFTGQFQVEHDSAISDDNAHRLAEMVGAPDGSRVVVGDAKTLEWGEIGEIAALLYHPYIKDYAIRVFADAATGERGIRNEVLERIANAPDGFILRLFSQQVAAAARYDYARILTYAAGKPGGHMNGYYTWPRIGYDGTFSAEESAKLPENLRTAQTVQDLMASPEGRQWWKTNGWAKELSFDLKAGSRSRQVLENYLVERKI